MNEAGELPSAFRIRRGGPADADFVRRVAIDVFAYLGDYGRILPSWLLHDGVLTHVAEEVVRPGDAGRAIGYTMLGFYPIPKEEFVADLLAIAVAPGAQDRGVGRQLLAHAIQQVQSARRRLPIRELRLSVAECNARARHLFGAFGFTLLDGDHGQYDGGQLALHLSLKT